MKRRQILSIVATGGIGTVAGCLNSGSDEHATIQRLLLANTHNEPVTIDLRIERDDTDETVYENSYDVGSGLDGVEVDCVWPDEPLRIMVRSSEETEWNSFSSVDKEGCLIIHANVYSNGTSFFSSNEECPVHSPSCHTEVEN